MNHSHLFVWHLQRPIYRVIILTLIHRHCHRTNYFSIIFIKIHTPLIDIGSDAFNCRVLALAPSGVCGHLWRTLRHIIIEGDDGIKVLLCC